MPDVQTTPTIRTVRVDRRLISIIAKDPQLARYLENLGLDISQGIPDAINLNLDTAIFAQQSAESAQSAANKALAAVLELSDLLSSLEQRTAAADRTALSPDQFESSFWDPSRSPAIQTIARKLDELEQQELDRRSPVPTAQEAFITPTLQNSWVPYGGVYNNPGYWKDTFGVVHLRGMVKNGTMVQAIFTLPAGYRPPFQELLSTVSNFAVGAVEITTAGIVMATSGTNTWVSLDGLTFRAA